MIHSSSEPTVETPLKLAELRNLNTKLASTGHNQDFAAIMHAGEAGIDRLTWDISGFTVLNNMLE